MNDNELYQSELFSNRLAKKYRLLRKWGRKQRVTCYRLYDRDIPEIPLACDLYEFLPPEITTPIEAARFMQNERQAESANDATVMAQSASRRYLNIFLYERPYEKPEDEEKQWLEAMAKSAAEVLHIDISHIIIKARCHAKGGSQYGKADDNGITTYMAPTKPVTGIVQEQGQLFSVNLSDYLDSGLFFDHRPLRQIVRSTASGKSVLNLFCYTGSFSIYAAEGKAKRVESVDLSNTYLARAKQNMELNGFDTTNEQKYVFTRADVTGFLNQKNAEVPHKNNDGKIDGTNRFDLIILDPPTFSNSKKTQTTLDINRDWQDLVNKCITLLTQKGTLYFSTNSRRLTFDQSKVLSPRTDGLEVVIQDITDQSIPEDYKNTKIHRCWKFTLKAQEN